jgi:hypothetical protein
MRPDAIVVGGVYRDDDGEERTVTQLDAKHTTYTMTHPPRFAGEWCSPNGLFAASVTERVDTP